VRRNTTGCAPVQRETIILNSLNARLAAFSPYLLAVLRIVTALLFMAHGTGKLLGFPSLGFQPPLFSLYGLAGMLEIVGGIFLVLGLFTRPVAFLLAGQMAVAYFMAHAPQNFHPILNKGESAVLFCFVFLYLVFAGPGAWSVDGRREAAATAH
jgi:putative oxidoreductase